MNNTVRITALLRQVNGLSNINGNVDGQRGLYDATAPIALQALARTRDPLGQMNQVSVERGAREAVSYLRLSEVSVSYDLPVSLIRSLRMRSASVSLLGRNLGLWTKYSGLDPEVNTSTSIRGGDTLLDYSGTPQPRTWSLRINLGY